MKTAFLYFHTLKHLKWEQFYFRIYRKLVKPKLSKKLKATQPVRPKTWVHFLLYPSKIDNSLKVSFLNNTKTLNLPKDWNNESLDKLWVYNLHYFEDLLSVDSSSKQQIHSDLLKRWVTENPVGIGNGW